MRRLSASIGKGPISFHVLSLVLVLIRLRLYLCNIHEVSQCKVSSSLLKRDTMPEHTTKGGKTQKTPPEQDNKDFLPNLQYNYRGGGVGNCTLPKVHEQPILDKDDLNTGSRKTLGTSRIVGIENTDCSSSICSADVVLTASLLEGNVYR